jgi:DNA-binding NtrC family response regulator
VSRGAETTIRKPSQGERSRPTLPTLRVLFTPSHPSPAAPRAFDGTKMTIGRADGTSITLADDGQVSRVHATITRAPNALHIADSSTNGTFVNGRRVTESALADGDIVRVGDSIVLVRWVSAESLSVPEAYGLVGDAPAMHELRRTIQLVGPTDATVLVTGESGTGKELVARAMHDAGRPSGPFVAVNCSAIPETLAESQLFGHVSGAFTGARGDHPGFFRAASGGVIFLDEIGELPLALQAKLLRAIEERAVIPVGAVQPAAFDARIVAATNRALSGEVFAGRFRGDLLARLAEIEIPLPPLRARAEDILTIALGALGEGTAPMSADLAEALVLFEWPYNVRELLKVAAELRIRGQGAAVLELRLVAERLKRQAAIAAPTSLTASRPSPLPASPAASDDEKEDKERAIPSKEELVALLREHGGRVADVARATGRSRKQVYRWLETHGIDVESFR